MALGSSAKRGAGGGHHVANPSFAKPHQVHVAQAMWQVWLTIMRTHRRTATTHESWHQGGLRLGLGLGLELTKSDHQGGHDRTALSLHHLATHTLQPRAVCSGWKMADILTRLWHT